MYYRLLFHIRQQSIPYRNLRSRMYRVKEVSTRLMRPTLPSINLDLLEQMVANWNKEWEADASVKVGSYGRLRGLR